MGKMCVAANCTNNSSKNKDITFHRFPNKNKEQQRYNQWVAQVKRTRDNWHGPTSVHSHVCSDHFTEECYEKGPQLQKDFGLKVLTLRRLKPNAIPTIFNRTVPETRDCTSTKKPRLAIEKLERKRTMTTLLEAPCETTETEMDVGENITDDTLIHSINSSIACQTEQIPMKKYTKKIQATVKCGSNKRIQTETVSVSDQSTQVASGYIFDLDDSFASASSEIVNDNDTNYVPGSESEEEAEKEAASDIFNIKHTLPAAESSTSTVLTEPKFIIFWSSLQLLLSWIHCPSCHSSEVITSPTTDEAMSGTLLRLQIYCESCGKRTIWRSQPFIKDYAAGNLLLSSAILFTGSICSKVILLFKHMGIWCINRATFFRHQREILYPAIRNVWNVHQNNLFGLLRARGDEVVIGGDGRADSMGHCAKYMSYTSLELVWNCIIDVQVVASSEVGGSCHMELEGLRRSLDFIHEWLDISTLITDRHRQIAKFIRENHDILHLYDIWHIAKGLSKKLEAAAKLKGCNEIRPWIQSIVNHLYWAAVSTETGQGDLIVAKWVSVVNHIANKHTHNNHLFPKCLHGSLECRGKKWIKLGSKSAIQIEDICLKKSLLTDISKLSGQKQTWNLEAFHSVLSHFAPKMHYFSPIGMECRTKVAALHYNENAGREQQVSSTGKPAFQIRFPKYKKGGYIVRKVLQSKSYNYISNLWEQVIVECQIPKTERTLNASNIVVPPTLCNSLDHPDKDYAAQQYRSRYTEKK